MGFKPDFEWLAWFGLLDSRFRGNDGGLNLKLKPKPGGAEGIRTPDFLRAKEALSRTELRPRVWVLLGCAAPFGGQKNALTTG